MTHELDVALDGTQVLERAKDFFAERVPATAAFPEMEGLGFVTLRGQGGEEIVVAVRPIEGGVHVRASTLFFDQAVDRFLSTLPAIEPEASA